MQKKYTAALFSLALASFVFLQATPQLVLAQSSASDSAEGNNASDSATREEVTNNLKKIVEKAATRSQVKGVNSVLAQKHGFIGEVSRLSQEAITVKQNGDSRILPFSEDLTILQKGKVIEAEQIEVGNWVSVIGTGTTEKFTPEYILVSTESLRPKDKMIAIGSLTEIGRNTITILQRGSAEEREFSIVKTSKLENVDGSEIKLTDLEEDLSALVIAVQNDDEEWEVIRIRSITDVKSNN